MIRRYGLRTVVSFQVVGEGVERERTIAKEMGADFVNLPMPGDGFGREEQFREVLKAVDDPTRRPVLVHCTAAPAAPARRWPCIGSSVTAGPWPTSPPR